MKPIFKKMQYVIVAALLLSTTSVLSHTREDKINILINEDGVVGAWAYTVENAPYEYSKGVLFIAKENDQYSVQVQLTTGNLPAEEVKVKGDTITFVVYVEGSKVSVALKVKGDKIAGESSSADGTFTIGGTRIQPE